MFDQDSGSQTLAILMNYLPGRLIQFGQRQTMVPSRGWISRLHPGLCRQVDRQLLALGFQKLGTLSTRWMPGWELRGFANLDQDIWAVHYVGVCLGSSLDLVTEFVDQTWITTTTHPNANSSDPNTKTMRSVLSRRVDDILYGHLDAVRAQGGRTVYTGGLGQLVEAMERYFKRSFTD